MNLSFSPKRLGSLTVLGSLALVLAGCNPGSASMASQFNGSNVNAADHVMVNVTCHPFVNSHTNNCFGKVSGTVDGKFLLALASQGGFNNATVMPNGDFTLSDCVVAIACKHSGQFALENNKYTGLWGTQLVSWGVTGYDIDATEDGVALDAGVAVPDSVLLTLRPLGAPTSSSREFKCSTSCLEVKNLPNPTA